jgi:hypothetical protein
VAAAAIVAPKLRDFKDARIALGGPRCHPSGGIHGAGSRESLH